MLPDKHTNLTSIGRVALAVALPWLCLAPVFAATYTFTEKGPPPNTDNWSEALSWSPAGGPPGPGDTAIIGSAAVGYTVNVDSPVTVANLTLVNSSLQGGSALTVTGNLESQFANLSPKGGITIGGSLTIDPLTPNAGATGFTCPITLNGSATVNSNGALLFNAPVTFVNNGNFTLSDGSQLGTTLPGGASFINNGAFYGGNSTCYFGSSFFSNAPAGTVAVNSGATLQMQGNVANSGVFQAGAGGVIVVSAGMAAHDGASFTGSGLTLLSQGSHTLDGTVTVPGNLQLGSATAGTPSLTLNGLLKVSSGGNFGWLGGALTGVGTNVTGSILVDYSGAMQINGLNTLTFRNCILTNNGVVNWTNNGTVFMGYNALIANAGHFNANSDAILTPFPDGTPGYASATFSNASASTFVPGATSYGTFEKKFGASNSGTEIDIPFYSGNVRVDQGNLCSRAADRFIRGDLLPALQSK